ncbi:tRNA 2-selenouridine(34) synthase MnmH [Cohnella sp. JJ-181]|uniref:tRNA 2-selenouridine(34) synthase MnmH n=1 Tax=Cohnella rhizoplanae TaxID=2974897 RepID=UPI0022FF97E3|nr:tRNA 2-selenouridine(34) synthase MnmH [Cohnella sp. JJ-181]CAI6032706.1 tRNA 2-selenouridine synthase [Cohnella sp. JJ-181]
MFKDIAWPALSDKRLAKPVTLIDVRSPGEYANATIPGSINIPLFTDEERAEIGTLYTQVNTEAAKERGLEIVSAKLPAFIKQFSQIPDEKVVFCWRGGMRSKTTATLLSLMGIYSQRLAGGYRAYRQWVIEQLDTLAFGPTPIVLQGSTGSGKTDMLHRLKEEGLAVIDLEGMAGHRGSIFGGIGLQARNQKMFDALLVQDLIAYKDEPFVLFEAESKRIGKIAVPDVLYAKRAHGHQITIELPVEARARQILQDYEPWNHEQACIAAFSRIRERIHTPIAAEIDGCLRAGRYAPAVEMLLVFYYDPLYAHSAAAALDDGVRNVTVKADTLEEAYTQVKQAIGEIMGH